MSFGKRSVATVAPPRRASPRASSPLPAGRPGWWSTYLLGLLAAAAAHMLMALFLAAYISQRSDYGFAYTFISTALGIVGIMIVYVPLFAAAGAVLRWLRVTSIAIYLPAVLAPPLLSLHWLLVATTDGDHAKGALSTALAVPSALAAALTMAWRNRARA